ncbi:MAG: hypothetical protein ACRCX2_25115, partial [Paraclostridium sp.]
MRLNLDTNIPEELCIISTDDIDLSDTRIYVFSNKVYLIPQYGSLVCFDLESREAISFGCVYLSCGGVCDIDDNLWMYTTTGLIKYNPRLNSYTKKIVPFMGDFHEDRTSLVYSADRNEIYTHSTINFITYNIGLDEYTLINMTELVEGLGKFAPSSLALHMDGNVYAFGHSDFGGKLFKYDTSNRIVSFLETGDNENGILDYSATISTPNGKLVGIPQHSENVIIYDVNTAEVVLIPTYTNWRWQWYGGCCASDGYVYFTPGDWYYVARLNYTTLEFERDWSYVGPLDYDKFTGMVEGKNGILYCAPYGFWSTLEIDTKTGISRTNAISGNSGTKWGFCRDMVKSPNGIMYGTPGYECKILKIDDTQNKWSTAGNSRMSGEYPLVGYWDENLSNGLYDDKNGRIICTPDRYCDVYVFYDIKTETFTTRDDGPYLFGSAHLLPDGKIYSLGEPRDGSYYNAMIILDPDTMEYEYVTLLVDGYSALGRSYYNQSVYDPEKNIIYIMPSWQRPPESGSLRYTRVLEFDVSTRTFSKYNLDIEGVNLEILGNSVTTCPILHPNGKIYMIPNGSPGLIEWDPNTKKAEFKSSACWEYKGAYSSGTIGLDGKIYMVPGFAANVLVYDPDTDTFDSFGHISTYEESKYSRNIGGSVLAPNGMIYAVPNVQSGILEINPFERSVSFIAMPLKLEHKTSDAYHDEEQGAEWYGYSSALIVNNKLYITPNRMPHMIVVDLFNRDGSPLLLDDKSKKISSISDNIPDHIQVDNPIGKIYYEEWIQMVGHPNGFIYCVPYYSNRIGVINKETLEVTYIYVDGHGSGREWSNVAYHNAIVLGDFIYFTPASSTFIVKLDVRDNSITRIHLPSEVVDTRIYDGNFWIGNSVLFNNKLYMNISVTGRSINSGSYQKDYNMIILDLVDDSIATRNFNILREPLPLSSEWRNLTYHAVVVGDRICYLSSYSVLSGTTTMRLYFIDKDDNETYIDFNVGSMTDLSWLHSNTIYDPHTNKIVTPAGTSSNPGAGIFNLNNNTFDLVTSTTSLGDHLFTIGVKENGIVYFRTRTADGGGFKLDLNNNSLMYLDFPYSMGADARYNVDEIYYTIVDDFMYGVHAECGMFYVMDMNDYDTQISFGGKGNMYSTLCACCDKDDILYIVDTYGIIIHDPKKNTFKMDTQLFRRHRIEFMNDSYLYSSPAAVYSEEKDKIYIFVNDYNVWIYDIVDGTMTSVVRPKTLAVAKPKLHSNGKIYGFPDGLNGHTSGDIMIFDTNDNSIQIVNYASTSQYSKFRDTIISKTGLVVGIPERESDIVVLDVVTNTVKYHFVSTSRYKYYGGCLGPDGWIYLIPGDERYVARYNPETDEFEKEYIYVGDLSYDKWNNGVVGKNGHIYASGYNMYSYLDLDIVNRKAYINSVGTDENTDRYFWSGTIKSPDDTIWLVPSEGGCLAKITVDNKKKATLGNVKSYPHAHKMSNIGTGHILADGTIMSTSIFGYGTGCKYDVETMESVQHSCDFDSHTVILPDETIVGIYVHPSSYETRIKFLNPYTLEYTDINIRDNDGTILNFNSRCINGAVHHKELNKVYFLPFNNPIDWDTNSYAIIELDVSSKSTRVFRIGKIETWNPVSTSAVVHPNGKIYIVPRVMYGVLEFDPLTGRIRHVCDTLHDASYSSAVIGPEDKIYFIPALAREIMVYDPKDDSFDYFGIMPTFDYPKFSEQSNGAIRASNGLIYAAPNVSNGILEINPYTKTITEIAIPINAENGINDRYDDEFISWGSWSSVIEHNEKLYFTPGDVSIMMTAEVYPYIPVEEPEEPEVTPPNEVDKNFRIFNTNNLIGYVDWGDGTTDKFGNHKYSNFPGDGEFQIKISGAFSEVDFNDSVRQSIVSVTTDDSPLELTNADNMFKDCLLLEYVSENTLGNSSKITNASHIFDNTPLLTEIHKDIFKHNTKLRNLSYAFTKSGITSIHGEIFKYNTELVNMQGVFSDTKFGIIPNILFSENTKLEDVSYMFSRSPIIEVPENLLDKCVNITNAEFMFVDSNLKTIGSRFLINQSKLISINSMFMNTKITEIRTGLFDALRDIESMDSVFEGVRTLTNIPDNLFVNNTKLKVLSNVFKGTGITTISEDLFKTNTELLSLESIFTDSSLTNFPEKLLHSNKKIENLKNAFSNTFIATLPNGIIVNHNALSIDMTDMFSGCSNLYDIQYPISNGVKSQLNIDNMFGCGDNTKPSTYFQDGDNRIFAGLDRIGKSNVYIDTPPFEVEFELDATDLNGVEIAITDFSNSNYTVDWGDGTVNTSTKHTYSKTIFTPWITTCDSTVIELVSDIGRTPDSIGYPYYD